MAKSLSFPYLYGCLKNLLKLCALPLNARIYELSPSFFPPLRASFMTARTKNGLGLISELFVLYGLKRCASGPNKLSLVLDNVAGLSFYNLIITVSLYFNTHIFKKIRKLLNIIIIKYNIYLNN